MNSSLGETDVIHMLNFHDFKFPILAKSFGLKLLTKLFDSANTDRLRFAVGRGTHLWRGDFRGLSTRRIFPEEKCDGLQLTVILISC